jgi:NNP family nitrate/nitrite transporter-like MFS transporter
MGAVMLALSVATSLALLFGALFFAGLSAGLYLPSGITILTELVAQEHLGRAMAVHELAPNLAFVSAPVLAEVLLRIVSWRGVLAVLGSGSFLMGLIFWCRGKGGEGRGEPPSLTMMGSILRKSSFYAAAAFFIVSVGASFGVYSMLSLFLVSEAGMSREFANGLIALSRTAGFVTLFLSGWITDRIGYRRAMVFSVALAGGLTFFIGLFSNSWTVPYWVLLQAPAAVCTFPAGFVMLSMNFPPSQRNMAMSMVIMIGFLTGGGVFPMGIGYVAERLSFAWSFSLLGVTILSVLPLLFFFRGEKKESPSGIVV